MARRVSWVNNSSGHTGTYVYRAPTLDPQNLPAPVATVDPVAQGETAEWIDNEAPFECYAVQDFDGQGVGALSAEVCVAEPPPDYANASVGDYIGGGVYAGIMNINGTDEHIISGLASSEVNVRWKTSQSGTAGTLNTTDGLANTLAMETAGLAAHPAASHCLSYENEGFDDWYMPAETQVDLLYSALRLHAEFSSNRASGNATWTSTEDSANGIYGRRRRFSDGTKSGLWKNYQQLVRPIRSVPV